MGKILYFIADSKPTEKELEDAAKLGTKCFRVASLVGTECLEPCDGVAGLVPERYSHLRVDTHKDHAPIKEEKKAVPETLLEKPKAFEPETKPQPKRKIAWTPNE